MLLLVPALSFVGSAVCDFDNAIVCLPQTAYRIYLDSVFLLAGVALLPGGKFFSDADSILLLGNIYNAVKQ